MEMNIHNININDKFVATKKVWFISEGTVVTVTDVSDDIISFVFGDNSANNGYMDFVTFKEHFERVTEKKEEVEVPTITEEYIAEIMENSEFETHTVFGKCTIVSCRLPNGFVITEYSSCVNSEDYDEDLSAEICFNKITDKIWELEAYRLQQYLWEEENGYCPCCCGDCEECEYDDECLHTDLDCDDCDDHTCPYNNN